MRNRIEGFVSAVKNLLDSSGESLRIQWSCLIRIFRKPKLPTNPDGKVLIHIGCGELDDPRYINVDTRPLKHVHYVDSINNFENLFPNEYADLIYACHVIEHVSHARVQKILKVLYKCLKKGGILRLSVPDFKAMLFIYNETKSLKSIQSCLMGGQQYDENFHKSVFDEIYLRELLTTAGFNEVRVWYPKEAKDYNFSDWAIKKVPIAGREWKISLNLEGVK